MSTSSYTSQSLAPLLPEPVRQHFLSLPPSHQAEWLKYLNEAKQEATKERRLAKMIDQLTPQKQKNTGITCAMPVFFRLPF